MKLTLLGNIMVALITLAVHPNAFAADFSSQRPTNIQIANFTCNAVAYTYGINAKLCPEDILLSSLNGMDIRDEKNLPDFWKAVALTAYQLGQGNGLHPAGTVANYELQLFTHYHLFGY